MSLAQRIGVDPTALDFGILYAQAISRKLPLHNVVSDKKNPFGPDLLAQRQKALEQLVPEKVEDAQLWVWEYINGKYIRGPSKMHLELIFYGYSPNPTGIVERAWRELGNNLSV